MKVIIIDNQKLTHIMLPEKVEGVFLTNYKYPESNSERIINIEADDNNWVLKSNGSIDVINNNIILDKRILKDYDYFNLSLSETKYQIGCYSYPSIEKNKIKLELITNNKDTEIKIGSDGLCDICYKSALLSPTHCTINYSNNEWTINANPEKSFIFVNKERVLKKKLKIGDIIFIFGLKIVWMEKFIQVNNPNNSIIINSKYLTTYLESGEENNSNYSPVSEEEQSLELYDKNDFFFHNPRLLQTIETQEVIIDEPPENQEIKELPFIFTIGSSLTMVASSITSIYSISSSINSGSRTVAQSLPAMFMCLALIVGSLLLPRFARAYTKRRRKEREKLRQTKYTEYINKKEQEIKTILYKQSQILKENFRHVNECKNLIKGNKQLIWNRVISDEDFLKVRLGLGNVKANLEVKAPEDKFTLDDDNLRQKVIEVVKNNDTLVDVPVTYSFLEDNISAIICETPYEEEYINSIILQMITYHSSIDLKIIFLLNGSNKKRFEYAKFIPHCFSEDKTTRYFATNVEEMKTISSQLEEIFNNRLNKLNNNEENSNEAPDHANPYKNFNTYYMVITDDYMTSKNIGIVDLITSNNQNIGFSLLILDHSIQHVPNQCNSFVNIINNEGAIIRRNLNSQNVFRPEYEENFDMRELCTELINIPTITAEALKSLPTSLSFLEMYNVSKIEQLNILNRWKTNDPTISLQTAIGVHTNGEIFNLDLHEKFHGPHGLVAGSTGSGKSEFIITYILSMAINYHPDAVRFVLIDYKGGGLAGAFENKEQNVRIPHLAGTITNLDTSEMNRTLVSINSELKRRQRIFNETRDALGEGTIDIYKYQKYYREGIVTDPIPHLFIISDEFAELKSQQPEFMDELISTARIGRSLGVHLILATQKPSGVVNEQIWSNSKFKICLKVQSPSDSMELLKKPDAAKIKEVGRFYLQVGYDEYFDIGQSGWAGAKYLPTDRIVKKIDDSIVFINNIGYTIKTANDIVKKENIVEQGDQLTNIVRYLSDIGKKEHIKDYRLWLDNIPAEIFINNLQEKYNFHYEPYEINPIIGEYDDPIGQKQGLLTLNLSENGNTIIWGMNGSGKENLLHTIIYSITTTHTPDEVNIYLIDMGSETLKSFIKYPHVGDICLIDDADKILNLLIMLDDEMDRRKDLFADYNGNIDSYNKAKPNEREKYILVFINNYEGFTENHNKLSDTIIPFYREGNKYGIIFICTLNTTNAIRSRTQDYFGNKFVLQMSNQTDYRSLLNAPKNLIPTKTFGRGITNIDGNSYEFQSAYICNQDKLSETIKQTGEILRQKYQNKAKRIPIIPQFVTTNLLSNDVKNIQNVPIGINIETRYSLLFDFTKSYSTTILSEDINKISKFTNSLLELFRLIPNISVKIIDLINLINIDSLGIEFEYINNNYEQGLVKIVNDMNNDKNQGNKNIYFILGLSKLKKSIKTEYLKTYESIFNNVNRMSNTIFIFVDLYKDFKLLQSELWYNKSIDRENGIWLGSNADVQLCINFKNISVEEKKMNFNDIAFVINKENKKIMKALTDEEGEN